MAASIAIRKGELTITCPLSDLGASKSGKTILWAQVGPEKVRADDGTTYTINLSAWVKNPAYVDPGK
jgi:hypothetical protein